MLAQDFGRALQHCRGPISHHALAMCMFSNPNFNVPSVANASSLASHLVDIEAGMAWPFAPGDFPHFVVAAVTCLPQRSITADFALHYFGALYYPTL